LRFVLAGIPEDGAEGAGLDAIAAANAEIRLQAHAPARSRHQGVRGAYAGAGRVWAGAANHHYEATPNAARRTNADDGILQPALTETAGASEHAALAADAPIRVQNRQTLWHDGESHKSGVPFVGRAQKSEAGQFL
jgi:hypothetical protein